MIPKIIHYCWFGGTPLSKEILGYIATWKKLCPDYRFVRWDESNSPMDHPYVRKVYAAKKWAFVADFVRIDALGKYGGIYLDTDMELFKPLDNLLDQRGFAGIETKDGASQQFVATGVIGVEKGNPLMATFLSLYDENYGKAIASRDIVSGPKLITGLLIKAGFDGSPGPYYQDSITIYPREYFYPITADEITKNTYAMHHGHASWVQKKTRLLKLRKSIRKRLFPDRYDWKNREHR